MTKQTAEKAAITRVLVVDDHPGFVSAIEQTLAQTLDLQCVGTAHSLSAARLQLAQCVPDVVLVDMGLDGNPRAGVELIGHVHEIAPRCEPIAVTVFEDMGTVLAAIEAGAAGYVLKGCLGEELAAAIRVVRGGGSPISPPIARQLLRRLSHAGSPPSTLPPKASPLSSAEIQMLQLAEKGFSHDEIAQFMGVTRNTVLTFAKRCYRKLQVHSRTEAVYEARRMGLLSD